MNQVLPTDPARHWGNRAVALGVFLLTLVVYTRTCTTSCPFWDSGEFIATSKVLGIPHPPGTPLYVLIGHLFAMLPFGTVAYRVNWLSALSSALAVMFTYLLTVRYLRMCQGGRTRTQADEMVAWTGGAAAAFFMAFSNTFWDSAVEAEVYALSSWMQVVILYLGIRWWEGLEQREGDNRLLAAWYLCFLCVGIHLGTFLVMPALVLLVLMVNWRSLLSPRNLAWAVVLALVGMSVHLYLYLRAKANPPVNEGDPETWTALKALLMREQYGSRPMLPRSAPWSFQFGMYFRYFLDQYVLSARLGAWLPIALGVVGGVIHALRHRKTFALQALTLLIASVGLIAYLNFTDHEDRARDYFFTPSFQFFAIWIGMGLAFGIDWLRRRWSRTLVPACAVAVALSLVPMGHYWFTHDRRGFYMARDYAANLLTPLPPDALVFTNGDNDTFPLWYLQLVEGVRPDVRVINLSLANADWYIRQLRDEEPRVPTSITDEEIARTRAFGFLVDRETGEPVPTSQWMVRDILRDSAGERPAYLAVTVPDHQGLDSALVLEGLSYRIAARPVTADSAIGFSGRTWVNEPVLRRRLDHEYSYRGLYDAGGSWLARPYKDENATRMARNYPAARLELAYALHRQGRIAEGIDQLERIERMDPGFTGADGLLGLYYMDAGDTARSLAYFQDRERREPTSDLFYYYGVCLGALGRTDEAVAKLERAGSLDPSDPEPWRTAAGLLEKAGRKEEAERMRRIAEGKAGTGGSS